MINTIPGWECLKNERTIENGEPWQYVAFSMAQNICSPIDGTSAIATIGQRDGEGRLYKRESLEHPHFAPRKFTITAENAETQLKVIRMVTLMLNEKRIHPDNIPAKVNTDRAWAAIVRLLKLSLGHDQCLS